MDAFDKYAEEYDRWFDENEIIYKSEIEALKRHIPRGKGLEIGVGTGRFAKPFNIKIGVDVSEEMAKIADLSLIVPSNSTPRIQESHILIGHIICDIIEKELFADGI